MATMAPPSVDQWDNTTDTDVSNSYVYQQPQSSTVPPWEKDPENPLNWPKGKKMIQLLSFSIACLTSSIGTSLPSSAAFQYQDEFGVTVRESILPVSVYVFALGLGPVIAGPLSETIGRRPIYIVSMLCGSLFTLGAALTHSFGALCFLRFMAGLCFSPNLAVVAGSVMDTWSSENRPIPMIIAILIPFLGPGFGPIIGSFIVARKGWRWTQWVLMMFSGLSVVTAIIAAETYHPVLQRRRAKRLGLPLEEKAPLTSQMGTFLTVGLLRPLHMLVAEPIVMATALYAGVSFSTLFGFFPGVPYVFLTVYGFSIEQQGLVFIAMIIGCLFGALTVMLCTALMYLPRAKKYPPGQAPPELRLFPGIIGSVGLPIGLFMFGWSARESVSWAVPVVAIIPFSWGNFCIFVCSMHYMSETYTPYVVASAVSAHTLARYTLAGILVLFTVDMYREMGIGWAASLFGFISLALAPVPLAFYRWGPKIRARSKYETAY